MEGNSKGTPWQGRGEAKGTSSELCLCLGDCEAQCPNRLRVGQPQGTVRVTPSEPHTHRHLLISQYWSEHKLRSTHATASALNVLCLVGARKAVQEPM